MILDLIGGHFSDQAVSAVKEGKTLRGSGDNWDMRVLRGHMTKEIQNEDLHLFASNIYVNRLNFTHLPNEVPLRDLETCNRAVFTTSVPELRMLKENFKILVSRICIEYLPKFKFLSKVTPNHIQHPYSAEMSKKSTIISLPIIDANEIKYNDCVKILRTYESWVYEIFHRAGLIQQRPILQNPPPMPADEPSNPDQPGAHVPPTVDDPMRDTTIPFAGDQLTRVRFAGAKDLLGGAHTPSDRFEHCSPFKPVMWHTKASFLQYCYSLLFDSRSTNQIGTLKYFRASYNRKNVTPKKVLDSYDGCEDLFLSVGKSYIVTALLTFFGMESLDSYPTLNNFPPNMIHKSQQDIQSYFDQYIGLFVDNYIFQRDQAPEPGKDEDYVKNYALMITFLSLFLLQLKDTAAEGDGDRNLVNQKVLLGIFKSLNTYSKYAIEMFVSIAQMECLLTQRMSSEFKWGYFCNWTGGVGRNVEDDLAQELCNNISKNAVKRMGGNKTINCISSMCRATSGIKLILENYDKGLQVHKSSTRHTSRSSMKDEVNMIAELIQLRPFQYHEGRHHNSFLNIKRSHTQYLNYTDFHDWLDLHKKQMSGH